jgi:hypothetical protein
MRRDAPIDHDCEQPTAFSWKAFKLSTPSMSVATLLWQRGIIIALCA